MYDGFAVWVNNEYKSDTTSRVVVVVVVVVVNECAVIYIVRSSVVAIET
jgi:hypothetical protein